MTRRIVGFLVAIGLMTLGARAHADDASSSPPPAAPILRIVHGRRYYEMPVENLQGERQTPWVFTLGGRSPVDYTSPTTSRTDASRVIEAVRHAPF